jgi:hypothetical protein
MSTQKSILEGLEEDYDFKVVANENNKEIEHIKFKDGRAYKFQYPGFFQLHDALTADNAETESFKLGLNCLYPENEKSPAINEKWLEKNKLIGLNLWSRLLRGLLLQPKT